MVDAHYGAGTFLTDIGQVVRARPHALAVADGSRSVTYAELWEESASWCRLFEDEGVRPDDCVAVWASNSVEWLASLIAASSIGAAVLSVNTNFRSHELEQMFERVQPTVLVLSSTFRGTEAADVLEQVSPSVLAGVSCAVVIGGTREHEARLTGLLRTVNRAESQSTATAWPRHPEEHAARRAIMFTSSGTTGEPKLIAHSQAALSAHLNAVADSYQLRKSGSRVMSPMPFCGVMGFETAMSGLVSGAGVVTQPGFDAEGAVKQIDDFAVTTLTCSDEALRRILLTSTHESTRSLRDVAIAVFGNDPSDLFLAAADRGFRLFQTYGSSEVHALICYPTPEVDEASMTMGGGVPITPMHRVRARGPEGDILPHYEHGSLEILTPHLMLGYIIDEETLARPLTSDGYFRTGDMGYTTSRGFVYLARMTDAIRLSGFLVEPAEIENYLVSTFGFEGAQVVGVQDHGRTKPFAFVIDKQGIDQEEILERCRRELSFHKIPLGVIRLDQFPTVEGPNGMKIRRGDLRDMAQQLLTPAPVEVRVHCGKSERGTDA